MSPKHVHTASIVGYFWHSPDGLMEKDPSDGKWKTLNTNQLQKINSGTVLDCDHDVEDVNGGLKSVEPVVTFLKRDENKKFLDVEDANANKNIKYHNLFVQCSTLCSMLICFSNNESEKLFEMKHDNNIITIDMDVSSMECFTPGRTGSYADSVVVNIPEEFKQHAEKEDTDPISKPVEFGAFCLYVVIRHQYTFKETNGFTTVVNLFVSKEVDAVDNKENIDNVLIDFKAFPFTKLWDSETLESPMFRCLIMDFLANGFTYVIGLREKNSATEIEKLKNREGPNASDFRHRREIKKVVVLEKISSLCDSKELNIFKEKTLPEFLNQLVKTYKREGFCLPFKGVHSQLIREASNYSSTASLKYGKCGCCKKLAETIRTPKIPFTYSGQFDKQLEKHYLLIIGNCEAPITINPALLQCDILSIDNFINKIFTFLWNPNQIAIYGTKEEKEKVKRLLTPEEQLKLVEPSMLPNKPLIVDSRIHPNNHWKNPKPARK